MSLVAYRRLDGNGNDALGANNLSLASANPAPTQAPGKVDSSMDIAGATNYYEVSNIFGRNSTGTLSCMLWINFEALTSTESRTLQIINKTDNTQFRLFVKNTNIQYGKERSSVGGIATYSFSTPTNKWTFFSFDASNNVSRLRLNGDYVATGTLVGDGSSIATEAQKTSVGGGATTTPFGNIEAKMDDVRLYDNTLTNADVKTYYSYTAGFF